MKLDELQSVQSRERQTDSLQQLRESFYEDAGEFIQQLREERDAAAERADDPFDAPEVNRLTDDINTAESTVEAIYERRVGKIVKMASLAAADMPAEEDGLTREERDLFETLVGAIENNREHVLDVLAGEASAGDVVDTGTSSESDAGPSPVENTAPEPPSSEPGPPPDPSSGDAATADDEPTTIEASDLMGSDDGGDVPPNAPPDVPPDAPPDASSGERDEADESGFPESEQSPASDGGTVPASPSPQETDGAAEPSVDDTPSVDRATVRITDDVGEILGVDQREYDLSTDDVVRLPEANATPLVDRDAAERLD